MTLLTGLDAAGKQRSPATMPGYRAQPGSRGLSEQGPLRAVQGSLSRGR
jgi:hypothetical protein